MDPTPPSSTSMPEHKLSGFLTSVLSLNVNPHDRLPEINSPLEIFQEASEIRFRSSTGSILSPIAEPTDSTAVSSSYKKRKRMKGTVHGSISVVHQIYVLLLNKCLRIYARVIYIDVSDEVDHDARAVVLVDIYLPNAVCSGWQFPKSGSVAASLLRHISCDWALRSLLLSNYVCTDKKAIWNVCDCHVLGCKLNCGGLDSSKKKLFELHEIFKTLPSVSTERISCCSRIKPADSSSTSGIWELPDDVLINILAALGPVDLVRISLTCHHLKSLAAFIMPCMKLKLFPHQQAAVRWMLNRERNSQILSHPLYMHFTTEDGFAFFVNCISGEIITGVAPTIKDFHGGMFCDEPGLGKTITALSLILKTQGTLADPPDGVQVIWCTRDAVQKCGYYEINGCDADCSKSFSESTLVSQKARRGQFSIDEVTPRESLDFSPPKKARLTSNRSHLNYSDKCVDESPIAPTVQTCVRSSEGLSRIRRNLFDAYEEALTFSKENKNKKTSFRKRRVLSNLKHVSWADEVIIVNESVDDSGPNETWVQCDACRKWRKISSKETADTNVAWFCRMNPDPLYKSCNDPEESWDRHQPITYLPGFCSKGTSGGLEENVDFFTSVLKEHCSSLNLRTKKALTWLAKLSQIKLSEMETVGLIRPFTVSNGDAGYCRIFQAFGLHRKVEKGMSRWHYPRFLSNLDFDLAALRVALCKPLDVPRLYLSSATLIVVPANLVDHWRTQIQRHVRPGQLQVYVWTDNKKPSAHNLAWDYDVVITTFNRLSAEWGSRKSSALTQVHWLRVMLDEGHTLGSSLSLTNKLQMAISLSATNRWVLTGTPTPNTPNSQLSHLQPLLDFLHEEVYGKDHKSWDNGILKPFEAEMEEGRSRLLQLLYRSMISARKVDLQTIPPCIKKVRFLDFTEEHAKSYNELVVTIRRNILMADWNDPSHVESLLNPKQWKFRSSTIKNVRLSCCVAGHIKVTEAGEDIQETMDMLVGNGLDPISEEYAFIKDNILNGGNCLRCKEWCRLPFITPCRHLLCLGCVALDSEKCTVPGCGNLYEMQSPEILARPENPNPKWPVPKDLIELQPSYKQDNWDPDWQSTSSSKVSYLIKNLKELQEVNRSIIYHADQETVANSNGEPDLPVRDSDLHSFPHDIAKLRKDSSMLPDKVIIFSQFLEHIHVIEQQLTFAGIKFAGMYSPMHSCNKMKSLATFQHDDSCLALLMDGSAALGLDLSFVTHVFLMEPIWDRSMEEQVISRAHRMGAARPIHVETLAMRGTIEEQMLEFLQDDDGCRRLLKLELGKAESEGPRPRRTLHDFAESNYLVQLSFVQTSVK